MVLIQQEEMKKQGQSGGSLTTEKQQFNEVLLSRVVEATDIDPLLLFKAGKEYFEGERTFWADPTRTTILVGLGRAYTIEVNDQHKRYDEVELKWKHLANQIDNKEEISYGTGPILLGGFSFDPKRTKTDLWSGFSEATFVLPKILLSVIDGKCFFTFNHVSRDGLDNSLFELEKIKDELLDKIPNIKASYRKIDYVKSEVDPDAWMKSVADVVRDINEGEVEKVVLAREINLNFKETIDADDVLVNLREQQPMSYLFAFENEQSCFIGASPERLVKKKEQVIKSTCLAGSIARGKTVDQDDELGNQLLKDQKNIAEHEFVISMIKDAMLESCETITSSDQPELFKMRDIQHLYTPIKGVAKPGVTTLSMVKKLHPTPALGGFPSEKALDKIREVELLDRGWYAAPIGWIDGTDNGEFAVAIRSGLLKGKEASLFAGCGIVGESEPSSEYLETNMKFRPMLSALGGSDNE
ncbi:isochorismate synthase [Litchfieldia alkalitelluris]|uniref:isochorismate synthase n=1 Tax=Litchfieldia alkalitelluris TaxID=304268 RepID=UPI001116437D|nr:isochorismate synthase [Litchfieldia alkalitelluris]